MYGRTRVYELSKEMILRRTLNEANILKNDCYHAKLKQVLVSLRIKFYNNYSKDSFKKLNQ